MPVSVPVPTRSPGDLLTSALWNAQVRDNINKLLERGHRVLTVAQFAALTGLEGTKGTVAPDEVYLEVDSTNGVLWHLAFESGEATYKWRFLGGPPLYSEIAASETTTSGTYAALATAGPAIALPRAGDYDVDIGGALGLPSTLAIYMSYDIGGTGAVDADAIAIDNSNSVSMVLNLMRRRRKSGLTTVTLTAKYRTASATGTFRHRWMSVTPTRIRHDA